MSTALSQNSSPEEEDNLIIVSIMQICEVVLRKTLRRVKSRLVKGGH